MPTLKSSPDIVFAVSPANAQSAYMPFYFLYLAGYLEKCGYTVEILNPHEKDLEANIGLILRELAIKRPRYVGLSCFVTDFNIITDLAARIKHSIIGTRILVGNAHPSIAPEDFISEHSPFDIVVRGEGELTVAEILSHPAEVSEPGIIRGIAYLKEGKPMITQNRELMDLAECGMPAYHLIDVEWYKKIRKSIIRRLATVGAVIYTGRGCPFQCTFCASNTVWQANDATREHPLVRKRPLAHVMQDLGILQNVHGFDFFYILDDTFGIREEDAIAFCDAYRASGLRMLWGAETRASCIRNERIVSILREAGCIQLDFGVESGSPRMLKSIKKGCDVGQIAKAFELCRKGGLRTFANVLINLPGEQAADLAKTEGLLAEIKPTYTSIGVTQPYPGTEIAAHLPARVLKEDYQSLNRLFPADKFRLSAHQGDLRQILLSWFARYGVDTPFESSLFKADWRYWRALLTSKHRAAYLWFILKEVLLGPLRFIKSSLLTSKGEAWQ